MFTIEELTTIPLFSELGDKELEFLAGAVEDIHLTSGEYVAHVTGRVDIAAYDFPGVVDADGLCFNAVGDVDPGEGGTGLGVSVLLACRVLVRADDRSARIDAHRETRGRVGDRDGAIDAVRERERGRAEFAGRIQHGRTGRDRNDRGRGVSRHTGTRGSLPRQPCRAVRIEAGPEE